MAIPDPYAGTTYASAVVVVPPDGVEGGVAAGVAAGAAADLLLLAAGLHSVWPTANWNCSNYR